MLATLITAALLAVPATQLSDDPANLLPTDTLMYFGTQSVKHGSRAAESSAMHLILNEPEVKAFLTKPVAAADAFLQQMLKEADVTDVDSKRLSLANMISGGGDSAPIGRVFMALTHVSMPEPGPNAGPMPDIGLVAGLELLENDDLALIRGLWTRIELPEEVAKYKGHDVLVKSSPEGINIGLTFVGNLAVASTSQQSLHAVIDRSAGGSEVGNSLGGSADYQSLLKSAGGMQPGASSFMLRVGPIFQICRGSLGMGLLMNAEADMDASVRAAVMQALDGLGLDALHWVGGVSQRELTGEVISTSVTSVDTSGAGLVPSCMRETAGFDLASLESVPGNCMAMSAFSVDWLAKTYDFALRTLEAIAPDDFSQVQGMIAQVMGDSNLRDDLLANVHGLVLNYTLPGEGFPGTPTSVGRVSLHDPAAFTTAIKNLVSSAGDMMGQPVEVKEAEHESHPFYELDISRTPLAMSMMQPAFALDGDQLVFSIESAKALKTALNGTVDSVDSLATNTGLMDFAKHLASKGRLVGLSYSDNAKTFGAFYGQVAGAAQMMAGAAGELPVDLALMPSEQAIAKHLRESFSGQFAAPDGGTFVNRSISQFELGDFMPILLTAGVVGASIWANGPDHAEIVEEIDPQEQVQRDLADIRAGMTVYKLSEDHYPSSVADLVLPVPDYPDGFLGRSEVPVDPWGNGYRYRLNERGKPFLWSAGPDGIDQLGEGDDIVIKKGY